MILTGRPLIGIGVDVVSWDRLEKLLARHSSDSLKRLLAPSEQTVFQNSSDSLRCFARFFAAKEAYFKASGGSGMGEEGFRQIEVLFGEGGHEFRVLSDVFDPGGHFWAEGEFFEMPEGMGAKVLLWGDPVEGEGL